jgi:hypothetical protein
LGVCISLCFLTAPLTLQQRLSVQVGAAIEHGG